MLELSELVEDPILDKTMSREARFIRDEVFMLCYKFGTSRMGDSERNEFIQSMLKQYDPINFEKAVFYNYPKQIIEGVYRVTSAKHYEGQKPGENRAPSKLGTIAKGATRSKNTNWLEVAKFDYSIWLDAVGFARPRGHIDPREFDVHLEAFTLMYVAFTNWYEIDFNFKALYFIWECAKKYSIDFVVQHLSLVEDPSKKNVDYIKTVIRNEHKILRRIKQDNDEQCAKSHDVINQLINMVIDKEPVDWDALDEELDIDMKNKEEFDKVKLS